MGKRDNDLNNILTVIGCMMGMWGVGEFIKWLFFDGSLFTSISVFILGLLFVYQPGKRTDEGSMYYGDEDKEKPGERTYTRRVFNEYTGEWIEIEEKESDRY